MNNNDLNKSNKKEQTFNKVIQKLETTSIERPRICSIDLKESDFEVLKNEGYYLYEGTMGSTIRVANKNRADFANVLFEKNIPENFHEYDILLLDLTNEKQKKFVPSEHVRKGTKQNSIIQLRCSFPTTIFDPRPLTASFIEHSLDGIKDRKFLQIIFACKFYSIDYEAVELSYSLPQRIPNLKHNIYSFNPSIQLGEVRTGNEVKVCDIQQVDLFKLLTKHSKNLTYHQTFIHPVTNSPQAQSNLDPSFIPLLRNINNEIVSFAKHDNYSSVLVFPNIEDKAGFLQELLKNICPGIVPELFPFSSQYKWKYSNEYFLPNHSELLIEKKRISDNFNVQNEVIDNKILENTKSFNFLHDLITETGDNLVNSIYRFLVWLDYKNIILMDEHSTSILEEDLRIEHDKGILIIETKGIGGTSTDNDCAQISKIKLRRCEERKAFDVYALYIVNHQRYLPPLKRKNPPFTENQIRDAINDKRGLLTTWQLFNLYFDIQNGIIKKEDARNEILKFGLIKFRPKTKARLATPKEILSGGLIVILDIIDTKLTIGQSLIAEKNNTYFKVKITSIQINDKKVNEVFNGEIGLKLDSKIPNGTTLWII